MASNNQDSFSNFIFISSLDIKYLLVWY